MRLAILLCAATLLAAQPNSSTGLASLDANILRLTKTVNANWGIYIKCLETGEEVALNADQQMDTMSVIKIPP